MPFTHKMIYSQASSAQAFTESGMPYAHAVPQNKFSNDTIWEIVSDMEHSYQGKPTSVWSIRMNRIAIGSPFLSIRIQGGIPH